MFKVGQRYLFAGNKCTVFLVTKNKNGALVEYDDPSLGHVGNTENSKYYDADDNIVVFRSTSGRGYYFVHHTDTDLILINEEITNYEIY